MTLHAAPCGADGELLISGQRARGYNCGRHHSVAELTPGALVMETPDDG